MVNQPSVFEPLKFYCIYNTCCCNVYISKIISRFVNFTPTYPTVLSYRVVTVKVNIYPSKIHQIAGSTFCCRVLNLITQQERRHGRVVRAARLLCRKSPYRVSSRLGCAMRRLENSLCQPSRKWVPFSN